MQNLNIHNIAQNISAKHTTRLLAIAMSKNNYLPHLEKSLTLGKSIIEKQRVLGYNI